MTKELFDVTLRAMRRDRAGRQGPVLFLLERTFDDIIERISIVRRRFQSALLIGCPDPNWPARLTTVVDRIAIRDPGPLFAAWAGGTVLIEDEERLPEATYDLCIAIGTLDTVNNLPLALANIRASLLPDALLIGALSGGDTLPMLRAAMRAADRIGGAAVPHVHPRIDGPSLCTLLGKVGFVNAVVDMDRASVGYPDLISEIRDLRGMAATNILADRSRIPMSRAQFFAASEAFCSSDLGARAVETFEILHFATWTPPV